MGTSYGPGIITRGLVLNIDPLALNLLNGNGLTYWLVDWNGGHPTTEAGLAGVFNRHQQTLAAHGFHAGNVNWAGQGQSPFWGGGACDPYPSYFNRTDFYGWLARGWIYAPIEGTYTFDIDGDDAESVLIDGEVVTFWYGGHGFGTGGTGLTKFLTKGWHKFEAKMEEQGGGDGIAVAWQKPGDSGLSTIPAQYFRPLVGDTSPSNYDVRFNHISNLSNDSYNALNFTSQSDAMIIANNTLTLPTSKTMEIWIRSNRPLSDVDNWEIGFLNQGSTQGSMFGWMYGVGPTQDLGMWGYGSAYDLSVESPTNKWSSDGLWHHAVITMDSNRFVRGYVDGQQITWYRNSDGARATAYQMATSTSNYFLINSRGPWNSGMTYVDLGYVRVYNRDLSLSEIQQNYFASRRRFD